MLQSSRLHINYPDPNAELDTVDVPRDVFSLVSALETCTIYSQGVLASRPTSTIGSPGTQGRFYYATDNGLLYYDFGNGWIAINVGAPGSVGTAQLADGAVTSVKLASQVVDASKLADGAVGPTKLAANAVLYPAIDASLKPSSGAAGTQESLRALGPVAGRAAPGIHASQHQFGGADFLQDIRPFGRFGLSSSASFSDTSPHAVAFNSNNDPASMLTSTTRIRPLRSGMYIVVATLDMSGSSWDARDAWSAYLLLNGSQTIDLTGSNGFNAVAKLSAIAFFNGTTNYVELVGQHTIIGNSGSVIFGAISHLEICHISD